MCVRQITRSSKPHSLCKMFFFAELIEGHMKLFVRLSHCSQIVMLVQVVLSQFVSFFVTSNMDPQHIV